MPLDPTDPWSWLRLARSDLAYAAETPKGALYEPSAFLAEQAVEKALKGVLIALGVRFPKTHNLDYLFTLLEEAGVELPESVRQAVLLMDYTIRGRYPAGLPELNQEEWQEALTLAEEAVAWAEKFLRNRG